MPNRPSRNPTPQSPRQGTRRSVPASPIRRDVRASDAVPVETLEQQADRLGLLDPLDVEPANVYRPDESDS